MALDTCVVFVSGVGYRVFYMGCSPQIGELVSWHIYDHIREDRRELFAAPELSILDLFQKLIDISGVGPRLAQKILVSANPEQIQDRILKEDLAFLTSISGVGKKTAQKIILEFKGVLVKEDAVHEDDTNVIEALVSLGYARREAIEISRQVEGETIEDKIRHALKMFSN